VVLPVKGFPTHRLSVHVSIVQLSCRDGGWVSPNGVRTLRKQTEGKREKTKQATNTNTTTNNDTLLTEWVGEKS